jgi:hypothetical protein
LLSLLNAYSKPILRCRCNTTILGHSAPLACVEENGADILQNQQRTP